MGEHNSSYLSDPFVATSTMPHVSSSAHQTLGEPRRSGRANKGSNSDRWQEVLDSARQNFVDPESVAGDTATDVGTIGADNPNYEQGDDAADEDRIRCVCGQTEEIEDEDKDFVQCDLCHVWQHNQCVGLPAEIPESQDYFCERCRPDLHQKLLKDMANGKFTKKSRNPKANTKAKAKPERKRKRNTKDDRDEEHIPSDAIISDDADQYNEGDYDITIISPKRQRSISLSDVSVVTEASETLDAKTRKTMRSEPPSSVKTGTRERTNRQSTSKSAAVARSTKAKMSGKSRKASEEKGPFENLDDIKDPERKKIATALVKLVGDALKLAKDKEGFLLPDDSTSEEKAQFLGLHIEFAMFDAQLEAKSKFRQLSFNLKDPKNPSLRQRVFDGSLTPSDLVQMSSEDMANPELKAKTEALREESLKQSVLVQETGPRIRRTHKGEEYVEGPDAIIETPSADAPYTKPRKRDGTESPMSIKSPSASPSSVREESHSPVILKRERSGSNFDINNVWDHIETPGEDAQSFSRTRETSQPTFPITEDADDNDEDLLGLLEGGEKSGSIKTRHNYELQTPVWSGQLLMQGLSDSRAKASLIGGPKSFDIDWHEALTGCIQVDGRIPKPDATKYLCHQKYSHSKSVFAVHLQTADGKENALKSLYNYFISKDRYGVIKPGKTRLRDAYIVPLPADAALPEFIKMLPSFNLPGDRQDMLLALLVVEKTALKPIVPEIPVIVDAQSPVPTQSPATTINEANQSHSKPAPFMPVQQQSYQALPQWQQPPAQQFPQAHHPQQTHFQQGFPPENSYAQRSPMNGGTPMASHNPMPPQLDQNAQAVLIAFLRAHPEIANNHQVISSPQLMATLLEEFVRNGGMRR